MKITVHFETRDNVFTEVKVEISMPFIPRIGDIIDLTDENINEAKEKLKSNTHLDLNEGNLENYRWVTHVHYCVERKKISVAISDSNLMWNWDKED